VAFEERNIKENNPTIDELKDWHKKSGLPLKKVIQYKRIVMQGTEAERQASDHE